MVADDLESCVNTDAGEDGLDYICIASHKHDYQTTVQQKGNAIVAVTSFDGDADVEVSHLFHPESNEDYNRKACPRPLPVGGGHASREHRPAL